MANMVDLVSAQAAEQNTKSPLSGLPDAIKTGVGLAQAAERVELSKKQNEEAKMALDDKKFKAIGNLYRAALFSPNKEVFKKRADYLANYAANGNIPFDKGSLELIYDNEATRLTAQKTLTDLTTGKVPVNPAEGLSIFATDMGAYNYTEQKLFENAASQNKNELAMAKIQNQADFYKQKLEAGDKKLDRDKEKFDQKTITDFRKEFNSNATTKELEKRFLEIGPSKELLSRARSGNLIAGEAASTPIAKLSGQVGQLSEGDVIRFGGPDTVKKRLLSLAAFMNIPGNKMPESDIEFLEEIVGAFEKNTKKSYLENAKKFSQQGVAGRGFPDEETALSYIVPDVTKYQTVDLSVAKKFLSTLPKGADKAEAMAAFQKKKGSPLVKEEMDLFK